MYSRLLQSIWRLQSVGCVKINFRNIALTASRSYAIGTRRSAICLHSGNIQVVLTNLRHQQLFAKRSLTVESAPQTTPKQPKVERLLQRIQGGFQRSGLVNYESVFKLMEVLEEDSTTYNQLLTADQTNFLLGACSNLMPAQTPLQRMQLFQRLWNYLESHSQLTAQHFLTALDVRRMNRVALPNFHKFLKQVSSFNSQLVNASFYEKLIEVACECGNMSQATKILAEMGEQQHALTERVFNALILCHARIHDLEGCENVLKSMLAANITASSETQTVLVCAHLENGKPEKAAELRKEFQGQYNEEQLVRMLKAAALFSGADDLELMERWLHDLPNELLLGTEMSKPIINVCTELVHSGKLDAAVALVRALPKPHFNENQDIDTFGAFFLRELFRAQIDSVKIIPICSMLVESGKNIRALHLATEIAMRDSPPKALPFLDALAKQEPLRPHYFWPLLMHNFQRWSENGILRTLGIMASYKVECDDETISFYVLPRLSVTLENPERALKSFNEVGVATSQVITPIMLHLFNAQKTDNAYQLIELYSTKLNCLELVKPLSRLVVHVRASKRYRQFAKLVHALNCKSDQPKIDFVGQLLLEIVANSRLQDDANIVQRLINALHKFSVKVSPAAAELIVTHVKKSLADADFESLQKTLKRMTSEKLSLPSAKAEGSSSSIRTLTPLSKHPRDMTRDELECHLVELEAKDMNTRGVMRRLLQICVRDGHLERALEIKQKCDELRVFNSPGMLASIFDMYIKLKDRANAEESLRKLKSSYPGFLIDEHKLIDYAVLLVQEEQLESAKQILSERASANNVCGGDYIIKNVWNLLTNVAHLAAKSNLPREQNLTRDTFLFLHQLHYCTPQNVLLGPIIREYLLRNDIQAAVSEFKKFADEYKHTPLQFELLSLLVRLGNASSDDEQLKRFSITSEEATNLLSTISDVVAQVHGLANMNSSLLLAFAESGTDQQLRRLVMNPEFHANEEQVRKNCAHLGQEGAMQTLMRLARCTRGLNHIISEQSIYDMLLEFFRNTSNYEAAVELFDRLEADDEFKISKEFLKNMVSLLKVNNLKIPSNLALRAQIL